MSPTNSRRCAEPVCERWTTRRRCEECELRCVACGGVREQALRDLGSARCRACRAERRTLAGVDVSALLTRLEREWVLG